MLFATWLFYIFALPGNAAPRGQQPLIVDRRADTFEGNSLQNVGDSKKLKGKFLHITGDLLTAINQRLSNSLQTSIRIHSTSTTLQLVKKMLVIEERVLLVDSALRPPIAIRQYL